MKKWMCSVGAILFFCAMSIGLTGCFFTGNISAKLQNKTSNEYYFTPALTDSIFALGLPDDSLKKMIGQKHAIALLGFKNSYVLFKGGDELVQVAQQQLDGKHMRIDSETSKKLFLKDKQVWGDLTLTYGDDSGITSAEIIQLKAVGFVPVKSGSNTIYQKKVAIEGVLYPPIKLTNEQLSSLSVHRPFNLYNSPDTKPPISYAAVASLPFAIAADVALYPVERALFIAGAVVYLPIFALSAHR